MSGTSRVLVAGGRGFLGRALVAALRARGDDVLSAVRPSAGIINVVAGATAALADFEFATDYANLESDTDALDRIATFNPTHLVYLASSVSPGRRLDNFDEMYEAEVRPMLAFARAMPLTLRAALFAGSCEEYGSGATPFREDQAPVCISSYGWGKISAFNAVSYVSRMRGLPLIWLRPFLLYGPGQRAGLLMPSLARAIRDGGTLPLSPGEQTRDFLYNADAVRMLLRVIDDPTPALRREPALNLCTGIPRRVREVGDLMNRLGGERARLEWGAQPYRDHEVMNFYGSREKFERLYGAFEFTDFEESLHATLRSN